jgi:cation-transporting ATPase E
MGDGAAASKNVSSIVLETNNFDLLPQTLDEGRNIVRNLRRAGKLFLVKNVFTLVLVVGALGVLGLPFPYLPRQVTLLNFLTIGTPAFFLMLNRERSASSSASGFLSEIGWFAIRTGLVIGLAGLLLVWLSDRVWQESERTRQTLLLSQLVVLGLLTLLRVLTDGEGQPLASNRRFRWLAVASLLLYLIVLYFRPVGDLFKLVPLTLRQWGLVLTITAAASVLLWASDCARRLFTATSAATRPAD